MSSSFFDSWTVDRDLAGADVEIGHRQLFMLPTRMGFVFSLLLFALLMAAINYENGLSYALTFTLAAVGQVSMLYTHRNLQGVRFLAGSSLPVFVGQSARFQITVRNDTAKPRFQVQLTCEGDVFATIDLGPHDQKQVVLEWPVTKRGYQKIPGIKARTQFPLGLLYTWSARIFLEQTCLVYPHPCQSGGLPMPSSGDRHDERGENNRGEDFIGLREYRRGDSLKQIHWKALARGQGMQTKQFGGGSGEDLWLDWAASTQTDTEARLQQLCRWVLDAEELQLNYGLRLPGLHIPPGNGPNHQHKCLKSLALFSDHE